MATANPLEKNGDVKSPKQALAKDIKLLVLGDGNCGKSAFIKAFTENNNKQDTYSLDCALVHPCKYEIGSDKEGDSVLIFEMDGNATNYLANIINNKHSDANGYIFMFALNDPQSFENMKTKWLEYVKDIWKIEPGIVVGTKKDLEDPQPLAEDNQVSYENRVKTLMANRGDYRGYFEFSSTNPDNINDIFLKIMFSAQQDRNFDDHGAS